MPTFDTSGPISASIIIGVGDVSVRAGDGDAAVVDIRPTDPSSEHDAKAAELTRVEFANGRLVVKAAKPSFPSRLSRRSASIDVTVALPPGSDVHGAGHVADFHCEGPLGDCRIKTGLGDISVDRAETVSVKNGSGDIRVEHVSGDAEVSVASGDVRVRELGGTATIKNSNGDTWVGAAGGDLRAVTANGEVVVDAAQASVVAKTARGDVRLGEAVRGSVVLETHAGNVEVGIREGTAAWLDVSALAGHVHNGLEAADSPDPAAETVAVRARTSVGDVAIRRSTPRGAEDGAATAAVTS